MTTVLVYGESQNDTSALEWLIPALLPEGTIVQVRKIRRPTILSRQAGAKKRATMSQLIAAVEKQERRLLNDVVVVAHRDCDALEPAHEASVKELVDDLRAAGVATPVPATPAWCMETWWMQFSAEVAQVRRCWRRINYKNQAVGGIVRAKDNFARALRPQQGRCPDYHESDSIRIAQEIFKSGSARFPAELDSRSLLDFRTRLTAAVIPSP